MVEHYFTASQQSHERRITLSTTLRGVHIKLVSASGVFSKSRIDPGSALLIESAIIKDGWRVLDLGCGYGPIGITLAKAFPKASFLLTDINERAVALAQENIQRNKVENADAKISNGFTEILEEFDAIVFNPPQTAGKEVCHKLISESFQHLKKGGLLELVARHKKGGQSLAVAMKSTFDNVRTIARRSGYHVYASER